MTVVILISPSESRLHVGTRYVLSFRQFVVLRRRNKASVGPAVAVLCLQRS